MNQDIVNKVAQTLVDAGSTFLQDKKDAYRKAIETETNPHAKWVLETILENAAAAEKNKSPLCDDTGIPHVVLDVGKNAVITGEMLESVQEGIRQGLRTLPGRPMAVKGDDAQRLSQSEGLFEDPGALASAPFLIRQTDADKTLAHILMFGGGPAIRAKTNRVFHQHSAQVVINEIIDWAKESTKLLGCTPCTLAVGILQHFAT